MHQTSRAFLRNPPQFFGVNEKACSTLLSAANTQHFPKQTIIIREGETPQFLHILDEGLVEVFATHDGAETTLDIVRPGSALNLAAVVRNEAYLRSARALASSRILMIPAQVMRDLCEKDADFAGAVLQDLAHRCRESVRALKDLKLRTSAERLANWIFRAGNQNGNQSGFELPFEKHTLASRLGMTPANLSRNLAKLAAHGVRNSGRSIVIENRSALAQFAKPNVLIDE